MYTNCQIRFVDDETEWNVTICSEEEFDPRNDEDIFFYGLSRGELLNACADGSTIEGEWKVISVGESFG